MLQILISCYMLWQHEEDSDSDLNAVNLLLHRGLVSLLLVYQIIFLVWVYVTQWMINKITDDDFRDYESKASSMDDYYRKPSIRSQAS